MRGYYPTPPPKRTIEKIKTVTNKAMNSPRVMFVHKTTLKNTLDRYNAKIAELKTCRDGGHFDKNPELADALKKVIRSLEHDVIFLQKASTDHAIGSNPKHPRHDRVFAVAQLKSATKEHDRLLEKFKKSYEAYFMRFKCDTESLKTDAEKQSGKNIFPLLAIGALLVMGG